MLYNGWSLFYVKTFDGLEIEKFKSFVKFWWKICLFQNNLASEVHWASGQCVFYENWIWKLIFLGYIAIKKEKYHFVSI